MESKFLETFQRINEERNYELQSGTIFVEQLPKPEQKTKSGLVLPGTPSTHKDILMQEHPCMCVVLMVGPGYYDPDTKRDIELSVAPGELLLVPPMSAVWYKSLFGLHSQGEHVLGRIRDLDYICNCGQLSEYQDASEFI
jgi:co-chaperonin GroES (HSP10)